MSKDLYEGMVDKFKFRLSERVLEDSEEDDDLLYTATKRKESATYQVTWEDDDYGLEYRQSDILQMIIDGEWIIEKGSE